MQPPGPELSWEPRERELLARGSVQGSRVLSTQLQQPGQCSLSTVLAHLGILANQAGFP